MFLQANSKWTLAKRANKKHVLPGLWLRIFPRIRRPASTACGVGEHNRGSRLRSDGEQLFFQEIFSASSHPCVGLRIAATLLFLLIIILIFSATFFHLLILMLIFSTYATGVQLVKTEDPPSWFDQHKSRCDALSGAINTLSPDI